MSSDWDWRRGGDGDLESDEQVWRPAGKPGGVTVSSRVYGQAMVAPEARMVQRRLRLVDDHGASEREVREDAIFGGGVPYIDALGRNPVQRRVETSAMGAAPEEEVHRAAAAGVGGSSQPLPHLDRIQASFGDHDVTGVRAHVGGVAADAAAAIGAEAYATGGHVAFRDAPDLHTAAHEAAHVVQQRGGVQLAGGVGEAGDAYEQQADAAADAVVRGESAEALLGRRGQAVHAAGVQRKPARDRKEANKLVPGLPSFKLPSTTIYIGGMEVILALKVDVQATDSHDLDQETIDQLSIVQSKLSVLGQNVAMAFVSGKETVPLHPNISLQFEAGLGEVSFDRGFYAKLGKVGVGIKGTANELLPGSLGGKLSLQVSGSLTTTAVDLHGVLDKLANIDRRIARLDALRVELEAARRERDALEARRPAAEAERSATRTRRLASYTRDPASRKAMWEVWDRETALNRELYQLREQRKLSDQRLSRLLGQIEDEATAIDRERGRLRKLLAGVRGKAEKKLGELLVKLAISKLGRLLLKLIPLIGWAMLIADIADGAELVYDIIQALRRAKWGEGRKDGGGGDDPDTRATRGAGADTGEDGPSPDGGVAEGEGQGYRGAVDGAIAESPEGSEEYGGGGPGGRALERTGKTKGEGSKASGDAPSGRDGDGGLSPGDAERSWGREERATIDPDRAPGREAGADRRAPIDTGTRAHEDRATLDGDRSPAPGGGAGPSAIDIGKQVREERATIGTRPEDETGGARRTAKRRTPAPGAGSKTGKTGKTDKTDKTDKTVGTGDTNGPDGKSDTLIALSAAQADALVVWNGADATLDPDAKAAWVGRRVTTTDGRTAIIDGVRVHVPALGNVAGKDTPAVVKYQVIFEVTVDGRQTEDRHTLYTHLPPGGRGHGRHLEWSQGGDLKQRIVANLQFSGESVIAKTRTPVPLGSMLAIIGKVYDVETQQAGGKTYYTFTVFITPTEVLTKNLHLPTADGDGETWQLVKEGEPLELRFTVAR